MKFFMIFSACVIGIGILIILALAIRSKRFFKTLFLNVLCGILGLVAVNLAGKYTGISLPVNIYTCGAGALLGVPGICGLLILQLVMPPL